MSEACGRSIRIPSAWSHHSCCLMGWSFRSGWEHSAKQAKAELENVVRAISHYERVRLLAPAGGDYREAKKRFANHKNVEVVRYPVATIWLRDEAPTFALAGSQKHPDIVAIDWQFNGWGRSDPTYIAADAFSEQRLAEWGITRISSAFVAEGGAILTDGNGTGFTTRSCLLNPNRNPIEPRGDRQSRIQLAMRRFGIRNVVWLEGDPSEPITSGHVDGYLMLGPNGTILVEQGSDDPIGSTMWREHDVELLRQATDADGRPFKIVTILPSRQKYLRKKSELFAPAYLNAYVANGAIIMASFGDEERDEAAQQAIRNLFPTRKVVAVNIDHISEGGGGIHCLTQPIPAI